nr:sulfite exporter TauE/SafE family protein [uncultured Celeribacter sp.]
METLLVLGLAGLLAGALNAIAGGGTFLSFPALVWAGVPPISANATATFAALPGYLGSAWAFRHDISTVPRRLLIRVSGISVAGGLLGALLLLITPATFFSNVVPWLLLLATAAFVFGPGIIRRRAEAGRPLSESTGLLVMVAVSIYGGYFNGGLGIMLLASFGLIGLSDLHQMNGLKNLLSVLLSVVSIVTYTLAGLIDWPSLLIVGLACALGGYIGARLAKSIRNPNLLRGIVVTIGLAMSVAFFLK